MPSICCLTLERDEVFFAATFAWAKTGKRMAARIAMIAMTTYSSIRVNALVFIILPLCIELIRERMSFEVDE